MPDTVTSPCSDCGGPVLNVLPLPEGSCTLCESCSTPEDPARTCESCDAAESRSVDIVTIPDGGNHGTGTEFCTDCAHNAGWECCTGCAEWVDDSVWVSDRSETYCRECARRIGAHECETCSDSQWYVDGMQRGPDRAWYCENHSENICTCESCNRPLWTEDAHCTNSGTYCESCHVEAYNGEPVSYRPASSPDFPTLPTHRGEGYTFGIEIEARIAGYPSDWDLTSDGSVEDDGGKETVSPILRGSDGLRRAYGAVTAMQAAGCDTVENGGVHVHVGAGALTMAELCNVYRNWETWGEDVFSGMVPGYRWQSGWCRAQHRTDDHSDAVAEFIRCQSRREGRDIAGDPVTQWGDDFVDAHFPAYDDRYESLNPRALAKHGTLECRIFPSAIDPESVCTWAGMFVRFLHVARSADPARVRAILDSFGTMRAGVRILCRGSATLQGWARSVSASHARSIPSRYSTGPGKDAWGTDPVRKLARRAERAERIRARRIARAESTEPCTPNGTGFLFPLPGSDKGPEHCEPPAPVACDCEPVSTWGCNGNRIPYVFCPLHGLPEFGGMGRAQRYLNSDERNGAA